MHKNIPFHLCLFLVAAMLSPAQAMQQEAIAPQQQAETIEASRSTKKLVAAIRAHDQQKALEAIRENANVNHHDSLSNEDFSKTDWTPLMEAIAELKSIVITAQSGINTTGYFVNWFGKGAWFAAGATTKIKEQYNAEIQALNIIINNLFVPQLDVTYVDCAGNSALSLCKTTLELLKSEVLYPPHAPRDPEEDYMRMFSQLKERIEGEYIRMFPQLKDRLAPLSHTTAQRALASQRRQVAQPFVNRGAQFQKVDLHNPPIVYHDGYNVRAWGLQKLHPFDTEKYGKIAAIVKTYLQTLPQINGNVDVRTPAAISDSDLKLVHSKEYLESIKDSRTIAIMAELPAIGWFFNWLAESVFMRPAKLAAGGTVLAAQLALQYGWAINIGAGFHHAKSSKPVVGGFCFVNDVLAAARKVLEEHPNYHVLIVDLDAHQGNGNAEIADYDGRIGIFDMYNKDTWPGDVQRRITFDHPLPAFTHDGEYLRILKGELPKAIDIVKPNIIFFNAGTDPLVGDPLGKLSLTKDGIYQRDLFVFNEARQRAIPIVMVTSGGYHPTESIGTISGSMINILKTLQTSAS